MKKTVTCGALALALLGVSGKASAKQGDFNLGLGLAMSGLYDSITGGVIAGPLDVELQVAKEFMQGISFDIGFRWGIDMSQSGCRTDACAAPATTGTTGTTTAATVRAQYLGARPGIHLYLGDDRGYHYGGYIRPYVRLAFPIDVRREVGTDKTTYFVNVGFLAGGGIEYRWARVGIFGEVIFVPFFRDFYMPIEFRAGIAAHF